MNNTFIFVRDIPYNQGVYTVYGYFGKKNSHLHVVKHNITFNVWENVTLLFHHSRKYFIELQYTCNYNGIMRDLYIWQVHINYMNS